VIAKSLGNYRIIEKIGAGGMGEVYRARDTRLERDVAVKVLPPHLADDATALARFEREGKAIAALSHPNILGIFDVGREGGTAYAVMELLEGQTLRERLKGGPLPVRKAVDCAAQIARGLAAAHEKGVVHRDLKPENIYITNDGRAKILDFGLAKAPEIETAGGLGATGVPSPSQVPTVVTTQPGTILGTVGYMAPEQVRGQRVDHHADIFALGAVLHEMLSGSQAFRRETAAETLTAILRDDPPDLARTATDIPPGLQRIVQHCLEKNPGERFQSAGDVAFDLEVLSGTAPGFQPPASQARRSLLLSRAWLAFLLCGALLGLAGSYLLTRGRGEKAPPGFRRLTFERGHVTSARFLPDGQTIVYGAMWGDKPIRLFSRRLESPEATEVSLPPCDILSVSRSAELALSIGRRYTEHFISSGRLARSALAGGAPREMIESVQDADWMPDGTRLVVVRDLGDKYRLELLPGEALYETAGWISHARVSPSGDLVAFLDHPFRGADNGVVALQPLTGKQLKKALTGDFASVQGLAWRPDGREIWFTGAQAGWNSELRAVTPEGKERVVYRIPGRLLIHDLSAHGQVLLTSESVRVGTMFGPVPAGDDRDLSVFDSSLGMGLSENGDAVLIAEQGETTGPAGGVIYLRKSDGSPAVRLGDGFLAALSPDQRWVSTLDVRSPTSITVLPTGPGQSKRTSTSTIQPNCLGWFPDSRRITFTGTDQRGSRRVYVVDIDGGDAKPLTAEGFGSPLWGNATSPDSKRLATIGPGRRPFLYPLDGGEPHALRGLEAGIVPMRFSADGRFLFCSRSGNASAEILRFDLEQGGSKVLWTVQLRDPSGALCVDPVDVTPDGSRYIYIYIRITSDLFVVEGLQ
jgi:Tol biopolymer transport system component